MDDKRLILFGRCTPRIYTSIGYLLSKEGRAQENAQKLLLVIGKAVSKF